MGEIAAEDNCHSTSSDNNNIKGITRDNTNSIKSEYSPSKNNSKFDILTDFVIYHLAIQNNINTIKFQMNSLQSLLNDFNQILLQNKYF
jgi:hypothetical protein